MDDPGVGDGKGCGVKRILVPYFLAGSGHLVSARAIAHYVKSRKPDWDIRFLEPADEFNSKDLDGFFRRSWHIVLKRPRFGSMCFTLLDKLFPFIPIAINTHIMRKHLHLVRDYLESYKPDLIVTTHWGCGHLFQSTRLEYGFDIPLYLVRNDLGGAFQIQDCGSDLTFVMSDEAREAFLEIGIIENRLERVNFLVRPEFVYGSSEALDREQARRRLDLPQNAQVVLLSAGGEGLGEIAAYAQATLVTATRSGEELVLMVITGRNRRVYDELCSTVTDSRMRVFGYREDMHVLMAASDLIVGKCGANYTMETLMMRKPFVITQVGAPNEVYNKEYVVRHGYGWYAPTPEEYAEILERFFVRNRSVTEMRERFSRMPQQSGADQIADRIITRLCDE